MVLLTSNIWHVKDKIISFCENFLARLNYRFLFDYLPRSFKLYRKRFLCSCPINILHFDYKVTSICKPSLMNFGEGGVGMNTSGSWYMGLRGFVFRVETNLFIFGLAPSMSFTSSCLSGLFTLFGIITLGWLFSISSLRLL